MFKMPHVLESKGNDKGTDDKTNDPDKRKRKSDTKFDTFLAKSVKLMEDAEKRQEEFLEKLFKQQGEADKEERQRDREFLLNMKKILANTENTTGNVGRATK